MINLERGREKDRAHQLIEKMASVWNTDSITVMDILDDQLNIEKPKTPKTSTSKAYYKAGIRTAKKKKRAVPKKLPPAPTQTVRIQNSNAIATLMPFTMKKAADEIFQSAKKKAPKKVSKKKAPRVWQTATRDASGKKLPIDGRLTSIEIRLQKEREAIRLRLQKNVTLKECVKNILIEIPRTCNRLELGIDLICDRVLIAGYRTKAKDFPRLVRGKLNGLIVDGFAVSTVIGQVRTYGWRGNIHYMEEGIRCLKKEAEEAR